MSAIQLLHDLGALGLGVKAVEGKLRLCGLDRYSLDQAKKIISRVKARREELLVLLSPCPRCGGVDSWTNAVGAVLCKTCVPPPTPEEWLVELEALARLHAGDLFLIQFEPDCCWLSYGRDGRGAPDAYISAVFKGCEALLDSNVSCRKRLEDVQAGRLAIREELTRHSRRESKLKAVSARR